MEAEKKSREGGAKVVREDGGGKKGSGRNEGGEGRTKVVRKEIKVTKVRTGGR